MISTTEQEISNHSVDSEVVLSVNGVSKKFCRDLKRSLFYGVQDIASELVGVRNTTEKLRPQEFWALKDVSFQLRRGEALGLVGKNGSGKSTLLRIIAGLIKPDAGSVEVIGRVAPLIALGAGFNPVLTGRENIYANMSILGLSKKEIDERFDTVVEFAEVGEAIDSPVQSYSSGMAARLGFSCAIHTEPDILLIDEVLAVGDVRFRAKCSRRLSKLRQKGTSFILVSHQSNLLLNVCDVAAYLSKGNVLKLGDTVSVVNQYETDLFETPKSGGFGKVFLSDKAESESSGLDITRLFFRAVDKSISEEIVTGEEIIFCVGCKARTFIRNACLFVAIKEIAGDGDLILHLSNFYDQKLFDLSPGEHEIRLQMPNLGLKPNSYTMEVYLKQGSLSTLDTVMSFNFLVKPKNGLVTRGLFYQPRKWEIIKE